MWAKSPINYVSQPLTDLSGFLIPYCLQSGAAGLCQDHIIACTTPYRSSHKPHLDKFYVKMFNKMTKQITKFVIIVLRVAEITDFCQYLFKWAFKGILWFASLWLMWSLRTFYNIRKVCDLPSLRSKNYVVFWGAII